MRAIRVHSTGGAEALTVDAVPVPSPGAGELLVRVEWAGVNFLDVYKRAGLYKGALPFTSGEEGAGVVVAAGDGASAEFRAGDRVVWSSVAGSYAEYVVAPTARFVRLPDGIATREGAAVMLQGLTAHYLATSTYSLTAASRCLVHAAAGGVGLLLVQIAKQRGAFVIATAGSHEKAALARGAGADEVIVYTESDFVADVRRITEGRGVDVVYDSVGQSTFLKGLDVLKPRGMMVLFGQSSGPVAPIDPQLLNQKGSLFLTRPTLSAYIATREEYLHRAGELFTWIARGQLDVRIGAEFPLEHAADAHRALEGRQTTGKLLLRINSEP
jgi:NADPH2:quinone reductase